MKARADGFVAIRSETVYPALSAVADVVLAYRPKPKSKAAKRRKRKEASRANAR